MQLNLCHFPHEPVIVPNFSLRIQSGIEIAIFSHNPHSLLWTTRSWNGPFFSQFTLAQARCCLFSLTHNRSECLAIFLSHSSVSFLSWLITESQKKNHSVTFPVHYCYSDWSLNNRAEWPPPLQPTVSLPHSLWTWRWRLKVPPE
jgi:hypothetical protein